jgi:hemerythrin-like domain-containing protein
MTPTEELMEEHEGILKMLEIMDKLLAKVDKPRDAAIYHLGQILNFYAVFVDKCHHGKEENFLCPAFEKSGIPKEGGPIGAMLKEHREGRELVAQMNRCLKELRHDESKDFSEFAGFAEKYRKLLVNHIEKENKVLFPMGEQKLSPSERRKISESFFDWEKEEIGQGQHEKFHEQMDALGREYMK